MYFVPHITPKKSNYKEIFDFLSGNEQENVNLFNDIYNNATVFLRCVFMVIFKIPKDTLVNC